MSDKHRRGGLSATQKAKLFANVKAKRAPKAAADLRKSRSDDAAPAFDFNKLPGFRELKMQRAAADLIGAKVPFFQVHDGLAAETSAIGGRSYVNFASYNYLGLVGHPDVDAAAKAAVDRFGTSVSASRIVAGERPIHGELEAALADIHGTEKAVVFVSGHATNVNLIGTLLGPKDLILCDGLIHNSILEGIRLSGATRMMFNHNDLGSLAALLEAHRHRFERALIAVEGIYSMDGDFPDLPGLLRLKTEHDAWLMVDEAHSIGVLGETGHGLAEQFGVDPKSVEIWMGTLSKTFTSCGGYVAGSAALVEYLKLKSAGFVYSVGLPGPAAAAALASAQLLKREPERVQKLKANGHLFLKEAQRHGLNTGPSAGYSVVPIIIGDSVKSLFLCNRLQERGINALPIIFPAVAEKAARIRFFITSSHTSEQIVETVATVAEELQGLPDIGSLTKMVAAQASN